MSKRRYFTDWSKLTGLIEKGLRENGSFGKNPRVEGRLEAIHDGLAHDNYFFLVREQQFVLRLRKRFRPIHTPEEGLVLLQREVETLQRLQRCEFPFEVPQLICPVTDDSGTTIGLIETRVGGGPLALQFETVGGKTRLEIIAEVAAAVHRLSVDKFSHLPPCADSESHVREELAALPPDLFAEFQFAGLARDWIRAHLSNRPATVLHGDLLPQNVLCAYLSDGRVSLIDWEYARLGDPAFDLAIVTRGSKQPLKESDGFQRFLAAYTQAAGTPMPASAVRIHEFLMILGWLAEAVADRNRRCPLGHGPDFYEDQLRALLRRSQALT